MSLRTVRNRTLLALPPELLDDVISRCPNATRITLCRVSKETNHAAVRWLYRKVMARTAAQIVRVCKTVMSNPVAARSIRFLYFVGEGDGCRLSQNTFLRGFPRLLNRTLPLLTNVRELGFVFPPFGEEFSLESCTFPHLQGLGCTFRSTSAMVEFLNRHPSITKISLVAEPDRIPEPVCVPKMYLPRLNEVSVASNVIPFLSLDAPIRMFTILFLDDHGYDLSFRTLCDSTHPLLDLIILCPAWQPLMLTALFRAMDPVRLRCLIFTKTEDVASSEDFPSPEVTQLSDVEWLDMIGSVLETTRFPHLIQIFCNVVKPPGFVANPPSTADYDDAFTLVQRWSETCPTLKAIVLPSGLTWYRLCERAWVPDMTRPSAKRWLCMMLRERRYPKVKLITSILQAWRKSRGIYDLLGLENITLETFCHDITTQIPGIPVQVPGPEYEDDEDFWAVEESDDMSDDGEWAHDGVVGGFV